MSDLHEEMKNEGYSKKWFAQGHTANDHGGGDDDDHDHEDESLDLHDESFEMKRTTRTKVWLCFPVHSWDCWAETFEASTK